MQLFLIVGIVFAIGAVTFALQNSIAVTVVFMFCLAISRAAARPIPEFPPVMTTTLPRMSTGGGCGDISLRC